MSDELSPLEVSTRKAFRVFYGNDDPIQFADLTQEQRKRFEAVALAFQDKKEMEAYERFEADLARLHADVSEALALAIGSAGKSGFSHAIALNDYAGAFDMLAETALKKISNLREDYERRIPHR